VSLDHWPTCASCGTSGPGGTTTRTGAHRCAECVARRARTAAPTPPPRAQLGAQALTTTADARTAAA
jgi:hypothetical protein